MISKVSSVHNINISQLSTYCRRTPVSHFKSYHYRKLRRKRKLKTFFLILDLVGIYKYRLIFEIEPEQNYKSGNFIINGVESMTTYRLSLYFTEIRVYSRFNPNSSELSL